MFAAIDDARDIFKALVIAFFGAEFEVNRNHCFGAGFTGLWYTGVRVNFLVAGSHLSRFSDDSFLFQSFLKLEGGA